jgi:hypothetical protein
VVFLEFLDTAPPISWMILTLVIEEGTPPRDYLVHVVPVYKESTLDVHLLKQTIHPHWE